MALSVCLALTLSAWCGSPARAQPVSETSTSGTPTAARDKLYDDLAADVELLERQGHVLKRVVTLIRPTVVHIEAEHKEDDLHSGRRRKPAEETGSGVVIQLAGRFYVLTNRHVIKDAPLAKIRVKLADGRQLRPIKVWNDRGTDVAVMSITATDLTAARVGNSDKVEIGDFVLAIGSPFGLSHSVSFGIISAKGRRDLQLGAEGVNYQDFLQTDAAINPGNSGGPLLNLRGEVVGINTAIASLSGSNDGVGFSIPSNMAMLVAKQLIERGSVLRAYLGVHLDVDFNEEKAGRLGLPRPNGARVTYIVANSPAAVASIQVDDVILQFDGVRIEDDNHLVNLVSLTPVGKSVPVLVLRSGKQVTISVKLSEREKFEVEK